jgi:teichuronic acid biosynthesis glycosyltransferase TuaC
MASVGEYLEASSAAPARPADASFDSNSPATRPKVQAAHVLTLTPFYPTSADRALGCFIAEPLPFLSTLGFRNTVIAAKPAYRGRANSSGDAYPATWMRYCAVPGMGGLATSGRALYWRLRNAVRRLHRGDRIDLIHAHAALPCGHAAALLGQELGIPFVVTVHGRDVLSSRRGGLARAWCAGVAKDVYQSAAHVVCVSARVQADLNSAVRCRSSVVHNGVDSEIFRPSGNLSAGDPLILSVGNLIPSKGHEMLVRSLSQISGRHPRLRCHVVGTGPEWRRLSKLCAELHISERVQFLGRLSRELVADALRGCSVFALPSSYEALGCVYLEAMATAKPTIGCRGQGIAEIIRTGENGWLIDPDDVNGLADALDQLLCNPDLRLRLGTAARRTVLEGLTLTHQAERLAHVYQECVV